MGLKLLSKKDQDWFDYRTEDGACRFLIRRIPLGKAQEIEYRHTGRKRDLNIRKSTMPWDIEQTTAANQDLAAYALVDSEGAEIDVTTEALATAMGEGVKVGDMVSLDGKLSDKVKAALLDEVPITGWILEKSATLHVKAKEEEEGKG
jgi:hypothetical protein